MKKLGLVSTLSLGLVLLAGCTPTATQTPVEIKSSEDMISMYNETNAITCNLNYSDGEEQGTSVMYIKDGMISQKTESNVDGENMVMYTLAKDGKMYVWGNVYGEGVGMSATYEMNLEEELQGFDDVDDNTKVTCVKGVKDNSTFDLPADIEFTSMDDWLDYDYESDEYYDYEGDELDYESNEVEENNEVTENNEVAEEGVVAEVEETPAD